MEGPLSYSTTTMPTSCAQGSGKRWFCLARKLWILMQKITRFLGANEIWQKTCLFTSHRYLTSSKKRFGRKKTLFYNNVHWHCQTLLVRGTFICKHGKVTRCGAEGTSYCCARRVEAVYKPNDLVCIFENTRGKKQTGRQGGDTTKKGGTGEFDFLWKPVCDIFWRKKTKGTQSRKILL